MANERNSGDAYSLAYSERRSYVDAVLSSQARRKIVVAGPGTGKTYLFEMVLRNKQTSLTLTFINALVEDLALVLCGLTDAKTLHSFARGILASSTGRSVKIFPKLSAVIEDDAKILLNEVIDFDFLFHNREDDNKHIDFYRRRKNYYDEHYGYSDIIFAAVKYLDKNKEKIPSLDLIVVDEFQDFNKLEVSLIDLLSEKSPILLTGDDDQAIYDFKSASTDYIRERHSDANTHYASFVLPYCSRCTRVIVDATNDVIDAAINSGRLKGRIDKPYLYFDDKDKDKESEQNPTLAYTHVHARQIPWFIEQQINEIAETQRDNFTVLIISPTKKFSNVIVARLRSKGFKNIEAIQRRETEEPTILDGLKLLLKNGQSNLGWRIVSRTLLEQQDFESLLKETEENREKRILDILSSEHKTRVREFLTTLRKVRDNKDVDGTNLDDLLTISGFDQISNAKSYLRNEITTVALADSAVRKIPIKATTIPGSKGLDAQYVFVTHFEDRFFIKEKDKDNISDQDIRNFLVVLTRAQRKVFLISTEEKDPTFLSWIDEERIERLYVVQAE